VVQDGVVQLQVPAAIVQTRRSKEVMMMVTCSSSSSRSSCGFTRGATLLLRVSARKEELQFV
jgi:hypothetical protein